MLGSDRLGSIGKGRDTFENSAGSVFHTLHKSHSQPVIPYRDGSSSPIPPLF